MKEMEKKPENIFIKQKEEHLNFKVLFETGNVNIGSEQIDPNLQKKIDSMPNFILTEKSENKDLFEKLKSAKEDPDKITRKQYVKNLVLNIDLEKTQSAIEEMENNIENGTHIFNDLEIQKIEILLDNFFTRKENLTKILFNLLKKEKLTKIENENLYYIHEQMIMTQSNVRNLSKKYENLTNLSIQIDNLRTKAKKIEEDIIKVVALIKKRISAELN